MITFTRSDPDGDRVTTVSCSEASEVSGSTCRFPGRASGARGPRTITVRDEWGETGTCQLELRWHDGCSRCDS